MGAELTAYREHPRERERIANLLSLLPEDGSSALDIGARDGHVSKLLAEHFERVVALDLQRPDIDHPRVEAVQGDVTRLAFAAASFDVVVCAEVLEHVPTPLLGTACAEIARVTARSAIIGVPLRQDVRLGRTLCRACGRRNPPWGHINVFDEERLRRLFASMHWVAHSYASRSKSRTNFLSASLMDFAGNPYGTYEQDEACVHCGAALAGPPERTAAQRLATRAAHWLDRLQGAVSDEHPTWLHVRFDKVAG